MDEQRADRDSGGFRLWPLLIAAVPFGGAIYQLLQYPAMVERNRIHLETTGHPHPRTLVGQPLSWAFVYAMVGLIVLAIAYGKNNSRTN
jgi:hypothetical protein